MSSTGWSTSGSSTPDADGRFTPGNLRRAGLVRSLVAAGIPLDGLGRRHPERTGLARLPRRTRVRAVLGAQRRDVRAGWRSGPGVPVELLMFVREAAGSPAPTPGRSRSRRGARPTSTARGRSPGRLPAGRDPAAAPRRRATACVAWPRPSRPMWQTEVIEPGDAAGKRPDEILGVDFGDRMSVLTERAVHRDVPPPADAGLDREHHRGARDDARRRPACTAGSSTRRPCASWTSPATRASPRSAATRPRPSWPSSSAGSCSGRRSSTAAGR